MISLALRSGIGLEQIIRQLKGIRCPHPMWQNGKLIQSCPDAIAMVLENYLVAKEDNSLIISNNLAKEPGFTTCPDCGGSLKHESGCLTCIECGFSRCG